MGWLKKIHQMTFFVDKSIHNIFLVFFLLGSIYGVASFSSYMYWGKSVPIFLQDEKVDPEIALRQQRYFDYQFGQASGATLWQQVDPDNRRYGLILGTSSVRTNIDPEIFRQSVHSEWPWIVSGLFGPSMSPMNDLIIHLTQYSDFRPELVILGIHPYMIKGYEEWDPSIGVTRTEHIKRFPYNWIFANHGSFNVYVARYLSEVRFDFFKTLGIAQIPVIYRPLANPWEPQQGNLVENYDEARWERDKKNGSVDWAIKEEGYDLQAMELKEFISMIETILNVWEVPVYVVLMPQAPYMNRDVPLKAFTVIDTSLADNFNDKVPLVDLRHGYPVEDFFDPAHLNILAKEKFSKQLGELFKNTLPKD